MKSTGTPSTAGPSAARAGADAISTAAPATSLHAIGKRTSPIEAAIVALRRRYFSSWGTQPNVLHCFPHSAPTRRGKTTGARMRLSLRFILPLALTLAAIAYAVIPLVDRLALQWFVRDLDIRTSLIANTIQEPLHDLVEEGSRTKVLRFFDRILQDERLFA